MKIPVCDLTNLWSHFELELVKIRSREGEKSDTVKNVKCNQQHMVAAVPLNVFAEVFVVIREGHDFGLKF